MSPRGVGLERQLCCLLLATSDVEVEKEKEEGMLGDAYLKGDSISLKAGNIFENNPLMCWTGSITLLSHKPKNASHLEQSEESDCKYLGIAQKHIQ